MNYDNNNNLGVCSQMVNKVWQTQQEVERHEEEEEEEEEKKPFLMPFVWLRAIPTLHWEVSWKLQHENSSVLKVRPG